MQGSQEYRKDFGCFSPGTVRLEWSCRFLDPANSTDRRGASSALIFRSLNIEFGDTVARSLILAITILVLTQGIGVPELRGQDRSPFGRLDTPYQDSNSSIEIDAAGVAQAEALLAEGKEKQEKAEFKQAQELLIEAFDTYSQATAYQGPDKSKYLIAVADIMQLQRQYESAIKLYCRAIEYETLRDHDLAILEKALNNMAIAMANQFKPIFALEQLSLLIDRGYLQIPRLMCEGDFTRCHRVVARIRLLSRDLVGLSDSKEALQVARSFAYASRYKAISHVLLEHSGFKIPSKAVEEFETLNEKFDEVHDELLKSNATAIIDTQEFINARDEVKIGLLDSFVKFVPSAVDRVVNPQRAPELLENLNQRLKPKSSLVEITRATSLTEPGKLDFVAYVATKTEDGQLLLAKLWLEEEATVREVTRAWMEELSNPSDDPHARPQIGLDMREIFWRPLSKYVADSETVYICGTDDLSELSWNTIPGIPDPVLKTPVYFWVTLGVGGLLLIISLVKRSGKLLIIGFLVAGTAAWIWFQIQIQMPVAPGLGEQVRIEKFDNAYHFLSVMEVNESTQIGN